MFVRMGGETNDIVVKLLDDGSSDLTTCLAKFDAGQAQCFLDRDRQKLWAVIEASFGTFEPFNRIVRGIFAEQLAGEVSRKSASAPTDLITVEVASAAPVTARRGWSTPQRGGVPPRPRGSAPLPAPRCPALTHVTA